MAIKPILFNTEMIRAILDGRKSATRRVVKPRYGGSLEVYKDLSGTPRLCERCGTLNRGLRPPYQISDILWVRETWTSLVGSYLYRADQNPGMKNPGKWCPSIHMPREAARIWLCVTNVRVERLQDIGMEDVLRDGILPDKVDRCTFCGYGALHYPECDYERCDNYNGLRYLKPFIDIWNSTVRSTDRERYGWAANPWVWVIEFERCEKPEGF